MNTIVQFKAKLPYSIKKRKKWYIISCPILDIHSQGDTESQAKKNLIEAISLFLTSCFERGTLDKSLKECGFESFNLSEFTKIPKYGKNFIEVPLPFLVKSSNKIPCHA